MVVAVVLKSEARALLFTAAASRSRHKQTLGSAS
jgi:hypothetical protein